MNYLDLADSLEPYCDDMSIGIPPELLDGIFDALMTTHEQKAAKRRVVCAAIRAADGSLLLGIRHYSLDMHQQIRARNDGGKFANRHDEDQGFVDQHGAFMNRFEAYRVAKAAGQIVRPEACGLGLDDYGVEMPKLYSEGLY